MFLQKKNKADTGTETIETFSFHICFNERKMDDNNLSLFILVLEKLIDTVKLICGSIMQIGS